MSDFLPDVRFVTPGGRDPGRLGRIGAASPDSEAGEVTRARLTPEGGRAGAAVTGGWLVTAAGATLTVIGMVIGMVAAYS
ncbi:hypothetical protein ACIBQ1_29195 [Nonomuraea sp. NPDC050153]|uniref:hypothetical protein n=1 Tax=Nonomuraea sp. NPDC050153 TaxID=3364359 RepID=UPI0037B43E5C